MTLSLIHTNFKNQTILVTINKYLLDFLDMAAFFSFFPELLSAAAVIHRNTCTYGQIQRLFVHIRNHQYLAVICILRNSSNQTVGIKFRYKIQTFLNVFIRTQSILLISFYNFPYLISCRGSLYTVCLRKTSFLREPLLTKAPKSTLKKHLSLIIRVGITIFACWWVVKDMDFGDVGEAFKKTSLLLWAAVIGTFIFSNILLSLRWWLFMRAWEIYINLWSTIKLAFLGLYFNNCLPGSVGGDLVRVAPGDDHCHRQHAPGSQAVL